MRAHARAHTRVCVCVCVCVCVSFNCKLNSKSLYTQSKSIFNLLLI